MYHYILLIHQCTLRSIDIAHVHHLLLQLNNFLTLTLIFLSHKAGVNTLVLPIRSLILKHKITPSSHSKNTLARLLTLHKECYGTGDACFKNRIILWTWYLFHMGRPKLVLVWSCSGLGICSISILSTT